MDESQQPAFVSPERFAELTGLSVHTVRKLVRDHRLAATRTAPGKGGSILIPTTELKRLHDEAQAWRYEAEPVEPVEDDAG